ncbi:tetraacyldisaccharide 4'-kinase [bacterium]|nr:tetraacyldisaccharide 4'-kinase [bacterium]
MNRFSSFCFRFFSFFSAIERKFFSEIRFLVYQPQATVISVGNLSLGGTGKTPVLMEILDTGEIACNSVVLTRGYRSPWERGFYLLHGSSPHPSKITDESLLINRRLPNIPILLGKNRAHSAVLAERWFHPRYIFLDDGFQYRRLRKDVELITVDVSVPIEPTFSDFRSILREPIERINDASAILLTRGEIARPELRSEWARMLKQVSPKVPIIELSTISECWINPEGVQIPIAPPPKFVFAFAAIGNPASFQRNLQKIGCAVVGTKWFRDHGSYSLKDLQEIYKRSQASKAIPVCTEKDRVKISPKVAKEIGLFSLKIRLVPANGNTLIAELGKIGINIL